MANDWIIDVIADLRTYARNTGLAALAHQLDEATMVAAVELASQDSGMVDVNKWNAGDPGNISRKVTGCSLA